LIKIIAMEIVFNLIEMPLNDINLYKYIKSNNNYCGSHSSRAFNYVKDLTGILQQLKIAMNSKITSISQSKDKGISYLCQSNGQCGHYLD